MPVESNPRDFFASLLSVHAAIQRRLNILDSAADAVHLPAHREAALAAMDSVLDYFSTAGLRHSDDEELTLFPRLRPLPAFATMLNAFGVQHQMNDEAYDELSELVRRRAPGTEREIRSLAHRFAELNRGHLLAEERALFPLAASALPAWEIAEMGRELREGG